MTKRKHGKSRTPHADAAIAMARRQTMDDRLRNAARLGYNEALDDLTRVAAQISPDRSFWIGTTGDPAEQPSAALKEAADLIRMAITALRVRGAR